MPSEITMPLLTDTMTEGTLLKWNKKEGDRIKANDEIAEVETDKATMPLEAFEGGTLAYIAVKAGQKVKVGEILAVIAVGNEDPAEIKRRAMGPKGEHPEPAPKPAAPPIKPGPPRDAETDHPVQDHERTQARYDQVALGTHDHPAGGSVVSTIFADDNGGSTRTRVRISPLARRIAAEKNVDLTGIAGTGPGGRIVQRDVLARAADETRRSIKPEQIPPPVAPSTGHQEVITLSRMRTAIATALQRSKQTVPHYYETIDIDVEELSKMRERLNQRLEKEKVRISIADFLTKALAVTLRKHPALNARFNPEKNQVTRYGDVHLGIAVAVPDGLIAPVLRNVNQMGLKEIRQRTADLIDRARSQHLRREELSGATFTVSNLGSFGIREFSAIINPPEVAILAVGAAEKRAVVRGDQIVARLTMSVTLSADHRVADGAVAADFLKTLKETLEEPGLLLA